MIWQIKIHKFIVVLIPKHLKSHIVFINKYCQKKLTETDVDHPYPTELNTDFSHKQCSNRFRSQNAKAPFALHLRIIQTFEIESRLEVFNDP